MATRDDRPDLLAALAADVAGSAGSERTRYAAQLVVVQSMAAGDELEPYEAAAAREGFLGLVTSAVVVERGLVRRKRRRAV